MNGTDEPIPTGATPSFRYVGRQPENPRAPTVMERTPISASVQTAGKHGKLRVLIA